MTTASLKKSLKRASVNAEQLGDQIRAACEHVDALFKRTGNIQAIRREEVSEAFEFLFTLLEEFRLSQEDLRLKHHELASVRDLLETERERYREIFEIALDGYLVADSKVTIEEANPAVAELLQVDRQKLVGMSLLLFVAKDDQQILRSELKQLQVGDVIRGLELRLHSRTGMVIPASITLSSVHNSSGELIGLHCLIRDVSKQKRAEEALRLSEERFRSIAQSARDAIIVADEAGNILSWNRGAQKMFDYEENAIWRAEKNSVGGQAGCAILLAAEFPAHSMKLWRKQKSGSTLWKNGFQSAMM
jgi:PAS domain S-box-containing protein